MEENANRTESQLLQLEEDFKTRLELAHNLFGNIVFRYEDENGEWQLSKPLYDGVMVALDRLWSKRDVLKSQRRAVIRLLTKAIRG